MMESIQLSIIVIAYQSFHLYIATMRYHQIYLHIHQSNLSQLNLTSTPDSFQFLLQPLHKQMKHQSPNLPKPKSIPMKLSLVGNPTSSKQKYLVSSILLSIPSTKIKTYSSANSSPMLPTPSTKSASCPLPNLNYWGKTQILKFVFPTMMT